ncbi:MAG TPA: lysophospholipid acyltransferase family protein [Acidimicrobiia bacterium]|nr:lysophospholipid acyltransferase family protein [Acidimicrobiia bacterium]
MSATRVAERSDGSLAFYRFARAVLVGLCYLLFRVKVVGKEKVPVSGPFVVAPTHRSIVDIPLTATITRRRLRFMGKQELWGNRFGAWLFTSLGGFPVDRSAGTGAARAALTRLEHGEPVVLFPEGTRRAGPRVENLQGGTAYLAVKAGVPILPVGIAGSEEIMPSGSPLIRPRRVAVVVGDLITPAPGTATGRARKDEIAAVTDRLQQSLQELFDGAWRVLGSTHRS